MTAGLTAARDTDALFVSATDGGSPRGLTPESVRVLIGRLGLGPRIPFSTRTLRHALRTEMHERGAPFEAVNEAFGHVTMEETVTHRLSGRYLHDIQKAFRESAEPAARSLLGIEGAEG